MSILRAPVFQDVPWIEHGFGTRASGSWPDRSMAVTILQIHSDIVLDATAPGPLGEGDAIVTGVPDLILPIRTADCVPILIADTDKRAIAAVHAGWRGTVARIVQRTIERMQANYESRPEDLRVALGPAIRVCCFEVGPEVAVQFGAEGRTKVDLIDANIQQLAELGIIPSQISDLGLCTYCNHAQFFSYRRDRSAERMVSAISIRS